MTLAMERSNHHCGYSSIAALSTVEHDYLNEGFAAKNFSEELPAEGVSASFLIRMEDVTAEILSVITDDMDYMARQKAIGEKIKELEEAASEDGKLNPVIKGFFEGNEYYMFVYKTYTDVRLVWLCQLRPLQPYRRRRHLPPALLPVST